MRRGVLGEPALKAPVDQAVDAVVAEQAAAGGQLAELLGPEALAQEEQQPGEPRPLLVVGRQRQVRDRPGPQRPQVEIAELVLPRSLVLGVQPGEHAPRESGLGAGLRVRPQPRVRHQLADGPGERGGRLLAGLAGLAPQPRRLGASLVGSPLERAGALAQLGGPRRRDAHVGAGDLGAQHRPGRGQRPLELVGLGPQRCCLAPGVALDPVLALGLGPAHGHEVGRDDHLHQHGVRPLGLELQGLVDAGGGGLVVVAIDLEQAEVVVGQHERRVAFARLLVGGLGVPVAARVSGAQEVVEAGLAVAVEDEGVHRLPHPLGRRRRGVGRRGLQVLLDLGAVAHEAVEHRVADQLEEVLRERGAVMRDALGDVG